MHLCLRTNARNFIIGNSRLLGRGSRMDHPEAGGGGGSFRDSGFFDHHYSSRRDPSRPHYGNGSVVDWDGADERRESTGISDGDRLVLVRERPRSSPITYRSVVSRPTPTLKHHESNLSGHIQYVDMQKFPVYA